MPTVYIRKENVFLLLALFMILTHLLSSTFFCTKCLDGSVNRRSNVLLSLPGRESFKNHSLSGENGQEFEVYYMTRSIHV